MNRFFFYLIFIFTILFTGLTQTSAQFKPTPVEKSSQKVLFNGKVYYIHKVLVNQTLFSISRAYGVTQQDIAAANPNVALEVIQPGQILRIPTSSALNTLSESYFGLKEKDFYHHKIEPHQTISYLSRKYGVSKNLIYKYNPETKDILQIGQIVKIPKEHIRKQAIKQDEDLGKSEYYTVKPGDTLYSLARKYGVSVVEIIKDNPDLRWGLKAGMKIKIGSFQFPNAPEEILTDSNSISHSYLALSSQQECDSLALINAPSAVKIVIMLPFFAEESLGLDSIINDSIRRTSPEAKRSFIGRNFIEFYEGTLLALDSLKSLGLKTTVFTYDTKFDTLTTDKILKELDIIQPNIIIGPVKNENIIRTSHYSQQHQIPLVLPFSKASKNLTENNPNVITLMPDFNTEINLAAGFLSQFYKENIILLHNQDSAGMQTLGMLREAIFAHFSSQHQYENALYKEIRINDTLKKNLKHTLREDKENIILIISNNEAYVSNVIGLLTIQNKAYKIKVVGLPSWQKFKNLRADQLHELNTYLYTPFYIDYQKASTQRFVYLCRKKLNYEPYKTARNRNGYNLTYLGYETGMIFLKAYKKYGANFMDCACHIKEDMPQLEYKFNRNSWGGYKINSINIINFSKDFNLVRVPYPEMIDSKNINEPSENIIQTNEDESIYREETEKF